MDHIRIIDQELVFGAKRPEFHFAFPLETKQHLLDVNLSIVTRAGTNMSSAGADQVHLYVDGIDVTAAYTAELRAVIEVWDQNVARAAYENSLKRWLQYARLLGPAYGTELTAEEGEAKRLAQTAPLASLVNHIGDTTQGWSGHLHLLNFIDQFGLPSAVSLAKVLQRHNDAGGQVIKTIDIKCLTVSSGRSPTWENVQGSARGAVSVRFELRYHDPLEDEVKEIRRQLTEIRNAIDQKMATILQAVSTGGQIQRRLTGVEQQVKQAQTLSEKAIRDLSSQDSHLTSLEATLNEIRTLVKNL